MSKKIRKPSGEQRRPTVAILLLLVFIFLVFVFIGFRQVRSAEERRLRLLAGFADRVETTLPDLADRFARIVTERNADQVKSYLALVPNVTPLSIEISPPADTAEETGSQEPKKDQPQGTPSATQQTKAETDSADRRTPGSIELEIDGPHVLLSYQRAEPAEAKDGEAAKRTFVASAAARIDLDQVIEPMIIPGIFDSLLVANSDGTVLHQHGEPELEVTHLATLLGTGEDEAGAAGGWQALVEREGGSAGRYLLRLLESSEDPAPGLGEHVGRATAIVDAQITDSDYSIFLQPITLQVQALSGQKAPPPRHWIAVGLISREHLLSAGVTTSPILLFLLVSLLPVGLITWPFLKLALISRRQSFTRVDSVFLILAALLGLSFVAGLLIDGLFLNKVYRVVDRQLAGTAEVVSQSFQEELLYSHDQLVELDREADFDRLAELDFFDSLPETREHSARDIRLAAESFIETNVKEYFQDPPTPPTIYPYFDSVFWPNPDGVLETANLPLRRHAVLPQRVGDREYFQCARDDEGNVHLGFGHEKLKKLRSEWKKSRNGGPSRVPNKLCLQPLLDRTTGEPAIALTFPRSHSWEGSSEKSAAEAGTNGEERPVAALVTQPTSLTHPLLPPQMGFAVVDRSGQVLFHSDARRSLTESFLKASDENQLLHSLLESRREGPLSFNYWGRRHRAYVQPIPLEGLSWTLITFRSLEDIRLRNFELIYDFLNPFLLNLGVLALLTGGFLWIAPRRFRAYLWPDSENLPAYRRIVWWSLGWLLVFSLLLWWGEHRHLAIFLVSFAVVPLTFLFVVFVLPWLHRAKWCANEHSWIEKGWKRGKEWVEKLRSTLRKSDAGSEPGEESLDAPAGEEEKKESESESENEDEKENDEEDNKSPLKDWRRKRRRELAISGIVLGVVGLAMLGSGSPVIPTFLMIAFATAGLSLWWFWHEFKGGERRKTAYTQALACLLLLSLLPTLGFLHLARSRQIQFLTQDGILSLARGIEERQKSIESREGPIDEYYDGEEDWSFHTRLKNGRERYLEAIFHSSYPTTAVPEGAESMPLWPYGRTRPFPTHLSGEADDRGSENWFDASMYRTLAARPLPLNDLSPQPMGVDLSRYRSAANEWEGYESDDGGIELRLQGPALGESTDLEALGGSIPRVGSLSEIRSLPVAILALGIALLAAGPFLLARFISEKLLLISLVYRSQRLSTDEEWSWSKESIQEVLSEARSQAGTVKRLVLVSGQLEREAWEGEVEKAGDDNEKMLYWEASFRKAWEEASALYRQIENLEAESTEDPSKVERVLRALRGEHKAEEELPTAPPSRQKLFLDVLLGRSKNEQPILITDFDPEIKDPLGAADQTAALRELVERKERSIVILSHVEPVPGGTAAKHRDEREARQHWVDFLGSFPIRYARDTQGLADFSKKINLRKNDLERALEHHDSAQVDHWRQISECIRAECRHTPALRQLGSQLFTELAIEVRLDKLEKDLEDVKGDLEKLAEEERDKADRDQQGVAEENSAPATAPAADAEKTTEASPGDDEEKLSREDLEAEKERLERRIKRWGQTRHYQTLLTRDHVISRIGAEARLHYRYLWAQCSIDEKLVLVQLADHGLVNPKYFGWTLDLMQKGLVVRAPELRLMNDSFKFFVRQETRRSQILEWQEETGPNAWGLLKWILPLPLLVLAMFLFITQRDAVSNAAAVLVALASLTPVVFNLYSKLQEINTHRGRRADDSDTGSEEA